MNWNNYFIEIAKSVSSKSKDPSSKVGCVIVAPDNTPVSFGFNGFVAGADESKFTWERPLKYAFVVHAEANALLYAKRDLTGCKAYITDAPCDACLKLMLQAKVREIWYENCTIVKERGTTEQKTAILALIEATGAKVYNINGTSYQDDLR